MLRSRRLYANIFVFGTFFFVPLCPWYVTFLLGAVSAWYVDYYELIFLGFLMDIAYGSSRFFSIFSHGFPLPFTVLAAVIVVILQTIKKRVRSHA